MSWPLSQDYNEAIQDPRANLSDAELRTGQAATNALGMPRPRSGNFADVYEFHCPTTNNKWALKCFTRPAAGLRERYSEISRALQELRLPFMVDFQYLEQGIRVRKDWYPLLKMRWIEGQLLNEFVRDNLDKPRHLEKLSLIWCRMAKRLREAGIAHGDLQHGNVILVPGSKDTALAVKLIDYDGMFVPALAPNKSGEVGHPNYQHPQRLREGIYNGEVDRFSLLVVATALHALAEGGRALWERYDNGDNLLFKETDLRAPTESALFLHLQSLSAPRARLLLEELRKASKRRLEALPTIDELLPEDKPTASEASAKTRSAVQPKVPPATVDTAGALLDADDFWRSDAPQSSVSQSSRPRGWAWIGMGAVVAALLIGALVLERLTYGEKPGQEMVKSAPPTEVVPPPAVPVPPQPVPPEPKPDLEDEPQTRNGEPKLKPRPSPEPVPPVPPPIQPGPAVAPNPDMKEMPSTKTEVPKNPGDAHREPTSGNSGSKQTETKDPRQRTDLLKLLVPEKHSIRGKWSFRDKVLVSDLTPNSLLQVPIAPPTEYRLHIVAKRVIGTDCLHIGLGNGYDRLMAVIDGWPQTPSRGCSGLDLINGKLALENETTYGRSLFTNGIETEIIVTVEKSTISVTFAGEKIIECNAAPGTATLRPELQQWLNPRALFLGSYSVFEISKFELMTISGSPSRLSANYEHLQLTTADRMDKAKPGAVYKALPRHFKAGTTYVIELFKQEGSNLDPYLRVENSQGMLFASDDDGAGNQNSRIVFAPTKTGDYNVIVTTCDANQYGGCTLMIAKGLEDREVYNGLRKHYQELKEAFELVNPEDFGGVRKPKVTLLRDRMIDLGLFISPDKNPRLDDKNRHFGSTAHQRFVNAHREIMSFLRDRDNSGIKAENAAKLNTALSKLQELGKRIGISVLQ